MSYSGLLDDAVHRFNITPEMDSSFFNRTILRNVFFSGRIYLNDGYLVNHPSSLAQILDEKSVLRMMVRNSFIKIVSRQPDPDSFAKNPENMAKRGVVSFQKLIDQPDWPDLRQKLYSWADALFTYNMVDFWPNYQMHVGFRKLFSRIFEKELSTLGLGDLSVYLMDDFHRKYEEHKDYQSAPRTAVESVLNEMEKDRLIERKHVVAVMNIANQCYHYNFAMCLSKGSGTPVVADTTLGRAFDDILFHHQPIDADISDIPILSIPKGFPVDDGSLFDIMLDPGSDLNNAKHDFLWAMDTLFANAGNSNHSDFTKNIRDASLRYQSHLVDHFAGRVGISDWSPIKGSMISFGMGKVSNALGLDDIVLAANLASNQRASSFLHKITKPVQKRILEVALDPNSGTSDETVFRIADIKPRFASLSFDSEAISSHVSDLPPAIV
jgi:hypothetical protein